MRASPIICAIVLAALPAIVRADTDTDAIIRSVGSAYTPDGRRLLYRVHQYRFRAHGQPAWLQLYTCPDGKPFARKTVTGGTPEAPDFRFVDALSGYREGVRHDGDGRQVYVQRAYGNAARTRALGPVANGVIDMGFDAFVRRHWTPLLDGTSADVKFLVPSRLRFYAFVARRAHVDARQVTLRIRLDRWFAFALPHVDLTYDRKDRVLRRFLGPSNVRDSHGHTVKVLVRMPPAAERTVVPAQALQQARREPLEGRCSLH